MIVRILLKAKKDWGTMKIGDTMFLFNEIFNPDTGIVFFSIDYKQWEVVAYDQWTGQVDRDNNNIYNNDIIEFDPEEWGGDNNIHLVSWDNANAEWSWSGGLTSDMCFRTVIGNIHMNKNLLK